MKINLTPRWIRAACAGLLIIGVGALGSGGGARDRLGFVALASVVALTLLTLGLTVARSVRRPPDGT